MPKPEKLAQLVFFVRDEKVMFDADLAKLYGMTTKALNQAISRNISRFPEDFAFRLTQSEFEQMRSQIVTAYTKPDGLKSQIVASKKSRGGRRYHLTPSPNDLACKIDALEKKYDEQFAVVFEAIRQLISPPRRPESKSAFTCEIE